MAPSLNIKSVGYDIEIISAPSILGLKPTGVEELAKSLLESGLSENVHSKHPVVHVPTLNHLYDQKRDKETKTLNTFAIRDFSIKLGQQISDTMSKNRFAFVLGGDCSILLGIMPALKTKGKYGLIFLDGHADFYEPQQSITGEVADMDLAIITGRGPDILTNINNLKPYVEDENVIHIGQRDWQETQKYGSTDIKDTSIKCFDFGTILVKGISEVTEEVLKHIDDLAVEKFWIHYDTDVLSDEINPAVDYRQPGGLTFEQIEYLLKNTLLTGKIAGISVSIFNPKLDITGEISKDISESIGRAFHF